MYVWMYVPAKAAVDSVNHWRRTACHVACDENRTNSHEEVRFLYLYAVHIYIHTYILTSINCIHTCIHTYIHRSNYQ